MRFLGNIKTSLFLGCASLSLLCGSCIMDDFGGDSSDAKSAGSLPKGSYYVVFDIEDTDGVKMKMRTRGELGTEHPEGNIDDGTHAEHMVGGKGNYVIYLNDGGTIVEVAELFGDHAEHPENYIEGRYVARFDVDEDYQVPASCIVILNAGQYDSTFKNSKGKSKSELWDIIWSDREPHNIGRDGERFTMTNAVHFSEGKFVEDQALPLDVVQVVDEPEDTTKIVRVKVERMVSKVTLRYDPNAHVTSDMIFIPDIDNCHFFQGFKPTTGVPQYKVVHFRVRPTGWGMNALEKSSYLFRHVNSSGNYFPGWSHPEAYRVYWSEDPHYDGTSPEEVAKPYPWQYRDAINVSHIDYYRTNGDNNVLLNYSYDDFVNMNYFEKDVYIPENTFDYDALTKLDSRPEDLAGTHFILTAILETDTIGDGKSFYPHDLYRDRIGNLYKDDTDAFMALVVGFNYDLQSQSEMKFLWYDWNGHGDGDDSFVAATGKRYSLYYDNYGKYIECVPEHIGEIARLLRAKGKDLLLDGDIKSGDGQKMIIAEEFKILTNDGSFQPVKIYKVDHWEAVKEHNRTLKRGEEEWVPEPIRNASTNDNLSIMFNWMGPIDHYRDGMMYYFAPAKVQEDVYGVVRNGWYQFVLHGIHKLGTSVDKPEEPIVPNWVKTYDQAIDIRSEILPWHVIEMEVPVLP